MQSSIFTKGKTADFNTAKDFKDLMRLQFFRKTSKDFIRLQKQGRNSGLQNFKTSKDFIRHAGLDETSSMKS